MQKILETKEKYTEKIKKILITEEQIQARVSELGAQISHDYTGKNPLFIGLLRGCFVFMSDIIRKITLPCTVDFLEVSSYNNSMVSSRVVNITKDLREDVKGRDVVIIDDITDSGLTLSKVCGILRERAPNSLKICTLLDKPCRRETELSPDYVGFTVGGEFVVGYGLDYAGLYRNLGYIGCI